MKYSFIFLLAIYLLLISTHATAHEPREGVSGVYTIIIGNRIEPPYAGQMNRFDMFIRDIAGNPVDVDEINLAVKILFLEEESFDAEVVAKSILRGDLKEDRETISRFNIDYLPTRPGTYGFVISGTINNVYVKEKFVCGAGSQHPEGRAFSCAEKLQKFPKNTNSVGNEVKMSQPIFNRL